MPTTVCVHCVCAGRLTTACVTSWAGSQCFTAGVPGICTHGNSPGPLPVLTQEALKRMNETPLHKDHSHGSSALQPPFPKLFPKPSGAGSRHKQCNKHTIRLSSDSKECWASPRGHFREFVSNAKLCRGSKDRAYGRSSEGPPDREQLRGKGEIQSR